MAVGRHRLTFATGTTIDRNPVNSIAAQGGLVATRHLAPPLEPAWSRAPSLGAPHAITP